MKAQLLTSLAVLAGAATFAFAQQSPDKGAMAADATSAKAVTIQLQPQNSSGESGTATLTPMGANETKVVIALQGAPKGVTQPAHIHEGSCTNLDPKPKQGLQSLIGGKSTTVVPVSLQSLLDGKMAINVHKSTSDIKTYVACGNLTKKG